MPDRAIEHDRAAVAQTDLNGGMHARRVPVARGRPDAFDRSGIDAGVVLVADGRDRIEVGRHPDPAVGVGHGVVLCNVAAR